MHNPPNLYVVHRRLAMAPLVRDSRPAGKATSVVRGADARGPGSHRVGVPRGGHFHKRESARAARLPIRHDVHSFHGSVRLENVSQLGFGRAVGQIANVKVLHCISSLNKSSRVRDPWARLESHTSASRGSSGLARSALERACDAERTAEIRWEASRIPPLAGWHH